MFKKVMLIGLISLSSLHGSEVQPPKKRKKISLWFKAIIPSIISYASLEGIVRACKNSPGKQNFVNNAKYAQWLPVIIGCYCLNIWMDTDLKEWMIRKDKPTKE